MIEFIKHLFCAHLWDFYQDRSGAWHRECTECGKIKSIE